MAQEPYRYPLAMLKAHCHYPGRGWTVIEDLDKISDLRADKDNLLWAEADFRRLTRDEIDAIAEEFELDAFDVEDAQTINRRPKLDVAGAHLLLVCHQLDEEHGQLEPSQLSCFVGDDYVLALHHGAERTLAEMRGHWPKAGAADYKGGAAFLLYTLLDVVVDDYGATADRLEEEVERLEESALSVRVGPAFDRQLYGLKQKLSRLRRYALPTNRLLDAVMKPEGPAIVPSEHAHLFRDIGDHLGRVTDQIHNIDDLANAVLELRRSEQTAGLSEVNKKLTAWAAIIAVPTLVSGVYGMNFRLVPRDGQLFGFWFALGVMAVAAATLYVTFKSKKWL